VVKYKKTSFGRRSDWAGEKRLWYTGKKRARFRLCILYYVT